MNVYFITNTTTLNYLDGGYCNVYFITNTTTLNYLGEDGGYWMCTSLLTLQLWIT